MTSESIDKIPALPPSCSNMRKDRITTTQLGPITGWIVDVPWDPGFMTGSSTENVAQRVWDKWSRYSGITREGYLNSNETPPKLALDDAELHYGCGIHKEKQDDCPSCAFVAKLKNYAWETTWLLAEHFGAQRDCVACVKSMRKWDKRDLGYACLRHWAYDPRVVDRNRQPTQSESPAALDCSHGTVNANDDNLSQVAAALADAVHSGGLSDAYYRKADDALKQLAGRFAETLAERDRLAEQVKELKGKKREPPFDGYQT